MFQSEKKNNYCEDLALEEAKEFVCCKNLTDEQIKELIEAVTIFTEIVYEAFAKKRGIHKKQSQENDNYKLAA